MRETLLWQLVIYVYSSVAAQLHGGHSLVLRSLLSWVQLPAIASFVFFSLHDV